MELGRLCVLDGIHRLSGGIIAGLVRLIQVYLLFFIVMLVHIISRIVKLSYRMELDSCLLVDT